MPTVFVNSPSADEQIDSLSSFFDGMSEKPEISGNSTTSEALVALSEVSGKIFSLPEADIKAFFSEFCALLKKLRNTDTTQRKIVDNVISAITDQPEKQPQLRLSMLNFFYNFFPIESSVRCALFLSILDFSVKSGLTEAVIPVVGQVNDLFQQWNATVQQKRDVYASICQLYKKGGEDYSILEYATLKKYLETFEGSDDDVAPAAPLASEAAVLAIRLDSVNQCDDLLNLRTVKQLQSDSKHTKLYQLLELFSTENYEAFEAFNKENPDFLQGVGLSTEQCGKKIRLLSLTSLAGESNIVSYSQISKSLRIEVADVEEWIINAISIGIIDARMDQANEQVVISQAIQRTFTKENWKSLQATLNAWKANVAKLLAGMEEERSKQEKNE